MSDYATWKRSILGVKPLDIDNSGDYDCVDIIKSRALDLWPDKSWVETVGYGDAKDLFANAPSKYWHKIENNNGADPAIDIKQGDFAVFGSTPAAGYDNKYNNPYGHIGAVENVSSKGITLLQQDSGTGLSPYLKYRDFTYTPLIGVLRPIIDQGDIELIDTDDKARDLFYAILHEPPHTISREAIDSIKGQPYSTVVPALTKYAKWLDQNDKLVAYSKLLESKSQGTLTDSQKKALAAFEAFKEALK